MNVVHVGMNGMQVQRLLNIFLENVYILVLGKFIRCKIT